MMFYFFYIVFEFLIIFASVLSMIAYFNNNILFNYFNVLRYLYCSYLLKQGMKYFEIMLRLEPQLASAGPYKFS